MDFKEMNIEYLPVKDLIPYDLNAKQHDGKQVDNVANSIRRYGWRQPLVIDKDNVVIIGHGRLLAAKKLGYDKVPAVRADDLTDEEVKELRIIDNKVAESPWDFEKLSMDMEGLSFDGFDLEFDFPEDFGKEKDDKEVVEDDYDEKLPEQPKSKRGEVYKLGRHRLMCGDSTSIEDVQQLVDGRQMDLLVTDPTYNVDYGNVRDLSEAQKLHKRTDGLVIMNDKMEDSAFRQFLIDAFTTADSVMKPGAVFYIWHADQEGYNFRGACRDIGWKVRECLIWNKNTFAMGRQDYHWKHEPCQPAGTMVRTPKGNVPIEELKDGDRVLTFDKNTSAVKGAKDGYEIKTASREYDGVLYRICAGGKETWATDNHKFSVRFNPEKSKEWCTYIMRRGDWWRVGITRIYDQRGLCLKHRADKEKAEEAWIIEVHGSREEARMAEQYISKQYGIPYTHWETERGLVDKYRHRSKDEIEWLYSKLDLKKLDESANRLLRDYGRSRKYPLVNPENKKHEKFSRRVTAKIEACNIIPGLMVVPVALDKNEGGKTCEWEIISVVERKDFKGTVYSLAVEQYEHYIADGIITHNCLYGWKEGAGHLWASDRKQSTVIDMNKPAKSEIHPTMKPIALFDYQIKNNTKGGDAVLDLFNGSGTTIMACEQNGRDAYCMELDPRYVDAAINRWEEFTGNKAELIKSV